MKYYFGQKGIWHKPASENSKARDIPAIVLEQTPEGVLYIFTSEPIIKGSNNLFYRTATIFSSDFDLIDCNECSTCNAELPSSHFLKHISEDPSLCSKCQSASVSVEGSRCSDCI